MSEFVHIPYKTLQDIYIIWQNLKFPDQFLCLIQVVSVLKYKKVVALL